MLKRRLSPDTTDSTVKVLRPNQPTVVAVDGGTNVSMALSKPLDESTSSRSPSISRESSQSLDESDYGSCHSEENSSESEHLEDDDDDADDNEQEDFALDTMYERVTVMIPSQHDEEEADGIHVYDVEDMSEAYRENLRRYLYTVNAFPCVSKHTSAFINLFKQVCDVPKEQEIHITDEVHEKFMRIITNCRAKLSMHIKDIMRTYTFDPETLPEKCKKNRKRQLKYMMDAMRFARKDYLSTGALLQSSALGDVIAKVFYARKETGLTLKDSDDKVPGPLIALAFVYMYVNMHMLCRKKRDRKFSKGRDAGAFRASLYRTTLHSVYDNGETVNWDEVQRIQTRHVHQKLQGCEVSGPFSFGPLSASYRSKYRDGEYFSDSGQD
ncbi:predicted protein [Lichtheimia corymbifera JMRC:FSU:9682]|uniref:Uncharacterized protein n=1 Tax=Lichtheimia corymbifera JMRC:FSU:9682 TaxID=1263082 RepID=A0A068SGL3_9FUNG|nr:predicted protein [Lichtheimia corymbifera JMRC:FSU:9682]